MKRIVFTGGLSCGKTTMINILRNLNYEVIGECSENLINNYKKDHGHYPWEGDDILSFHKKIFSKQLKNQQNASDGLVFLDRSLIDRLAFFEFDDLPIPEELLDTAKSMRYEKVLFFKGDKKVYQTAEHRPHSIADSARIEKLIKKNYKKFGYKLEMIPFCPKEKRLKIILEKACI